MAITKDFYDYAVVQSRKYDNWIKNIYANFSNYTEKEQEQFIEIVSDLQNLNNELHKVKTAYEKQEKDKVKIRNTYTVIDNDTLPIIANKYYKNPFKWELIYKANKLADVKLQVGQTLIIPADNGN